MALSSFAFIRFISRTCRQTAACARRIFWLMPVLITAASPTGLLAQAPPSLEEGGREPAASPRMLYRALPYGRLDGFGYGEPSLGKNTAPAWQHPKPQGNSLLGMSFPTARTGWAVGARGIIMSTSDGGESWIVQNGGTTAWLADVDFYNESIGWIAGESGTILHTQNGGAAWAEQTSPRAQHLSAIFFSDLRTGWAVGDGGTVISTADGGVNWLPRTAGVTSWLSDVFFVNNTTGWAVGDSGVILKSSSGGANWNRMQSGTSASLSSVFFTTPDSGWAVGEEGIVLTTGDGGNTWTKKIIPTGHRLNKISFLDSRIGFICGWYGTIFRTDNNGASWTKISSGTRDDLEDILLTDLLNGLAIGAWGTILKTVDTGTSWEGVASRWTSEILYAVSFADSASGWAVGDRGTILHTADGGAIWNIRPSGTTYLLRDVFFIDRNTGWAVGDSGIVLKTTDGGGSWSPQTSGIKTFLSSVFFLDEARGWIAGSAGTILATADGGATWTPQETEFESRTREWLSDIFFRDPLLGWAVGKDGVILRTADGGESWRESRTIAVPDSAAQDSSQADGPGFRWSIHWLLSVQFSNDSTGWVTGGNGTILHTADGGATWAQQKNLTANWTAAWLYKVVMLSSSEGWAAGRDETAGVLLRTVDGGLRWFLVETGSANGFFGLSVDSNERGWAVGEGGSILTFHAPGLNLPNRSSAVRYAGYAINTGSSAAVAFTDSFAAVHPSDSLFRLLPGDEIGFFGVLGTPAGGGVFRSTNDVITVWGDDPETYEKEGFAEGDVILMKIWSESEKLEYSGMPVFGSGSGNFIPDALSRLDKIELQGFPAGKPVIQIIPGDARQAGAFFDNAHTVRMNFTSGDAAGHTVIFVSYDDSLTIFGPSFPHPQKAVEIAHVSLDADVPFEGEIIFGYPPADSMGMITDGMLQSDLTIVYFDSMTLRWIAVSTEIDSQSNRASASFIPEWSLWMLGDRTDDIITAVRAGSEPAPAHFTLSQNYPNPFNPSTTIRYSLPRDSDVELKIYGILGQEIAVLSSGRRQAGEYELEWDGRNAAGILMPSGVYFYRLRTGEFVMTKKMLLLR